MTDARLERPEGGSSLALRFLVGVALDAAGALLVADDVGNTVWRVTGSVRQETDAGPRQE